MKYSMTCTCGHETGVEADSLESAKKMMMDQMTQEELDKHWAQNHQNDTGPKPTLEQSHEMINQTLHEVTA